MTAKRKPKNKKADGGGITGRYVYDKESGEVVKVSDEVPGLASKTSSGPPLGPCGRPCGGAPCAKD